MFNRIFLEHPASVNESYSQHFLVAAGFGLSLLIAAGICLVHAILPCLFVSTGSKMINDLHERMVTHRVRHEI